MGRNYTLIRSIIFGFMSKLIGSALVFLGLPVISHNLSAAEYAEFLQSMSVVSLITIVYGAAASTFVRDFSHALSSNDQDRFQTEFQASIGLSIALTGCLFLGFAAYSALSLASKMSAPRSLDYAVLLSLILGLFQWGDSYWVAIRRDHISSLTQMIGGALTVTLLFLFKNFGIIGFTLVYFGLPALANIFLVGCALWVNAVPCRPNISPARIVEYAREMIPLCVNSLADYIKIFVTPILLVYFSDIESYTRVATLILLVARFTNPISLLTRPMLPTVVDAVARHDQNWLVRLRIIFLTASLSLLFLILLTASYIKPENLAWFFPEKLGSLKKSEIISASLLLWSQIQISSILPLFIAGRKIHNYLIINASGVAAGLFIGFCLLLSGIGDYYIAAIAAANSLAAIFMLFNGTSLNSFGFRDYKAHRQNQKNPRHGEKSGD